MREMKEDLVGVQRQPVRGLKVCAEPARQRGMRPQELRPRLDFGRLARGTGLDALSAHDIRHYSPRCRFSTARARMSRRANWSASSSAAIAAGGWVISSTT